MGLFIDVSLKFTDSPLKLDTGDTVTLVCVLIVCWYVLLPALFVAINVTVKVPAVVKTCDGFLTVLTLPSPKFQLQDVGEFIDVSVNCTVSGVKPEVIFDVNEAIGENDVMLVERYVNNDVQGDPHPVHKS